MTLQQIRQFAVARSLFPPATLPRTIEQLGFVQADPIRAPARAQDLILRHRVNDYRAGDLERRYAALGIEEDVFINYGFVSAALHRLMHPRPLMKGWTRTAKGRAAAILEFVRERPGAHPRDVDAHFAHGRTTNYWGGSSSTTTWLLEHMHYDGVLRVARRDRGVRVYAVREPSPPVDRNERDRRLNALVDVLINIYAPVPARSLTMLVSRLRYAVPQWRSALGNTLARAKNRLARTRVDGMEWYWPDAESPVFEVPALVRLLAPFDPVVWDRRRFELLWNWQYRFEAYTPVAKRKLGYYALPMLWRGSVIGWANVSHVAGELRVQVGYVNGRAPRETTFRRELEAEIERMRIFLASA